MYQIVVPQSPALEDCQVLHSSIGQFGVDCIEAYFRSYFYCPGKKDWVEQACQECLLCALHKMPDEQTTALVISSSELFELLTMDFLTVAKTSFGFCYALVFVYLFSKFSILAHHL